MITRQKTRNSMEHSCTERDILRESDSMNCRIMKLRLIDFGFAIEIDFSFGLEFDA